MATLLKERSTYWARDNTSSHNAYFDYRGYWKIYYEQSVEDKKLLRTKIIVDYYKQTYWDGTSLGIAATTNSNAYINGTSIGTISLTTNESNGEGTQLAKKGSKTTYIYHNKDGTGSFTFRGTAFGLGTSTSTYNLPKIIVGTEISNDSTNENYIDLGTDVTFTLKPLTGQVEANKLYYKINDVEHVINESTTETSVKYSFPVDIITNYPNNEKISLNIYCKNLVSNVETMTTVYLKLPSSYVPTASLSIEDAMENKPEILKDLWIKSKSKVKGTITANGVKGSTIKSYLSSLSDFNQQYTSNPFTTQPLSVAGNRTITSKVTDTRERSVEVTKEINVIDYNKPTFASLSVKRCLEDGTISESGTCAKLICKYSISSIENLNTKSLSVKLDDENAVDIPLTEYSGEISKVVFDNINQANSYNITATLSDLFENIPQKFILGIAYKTRSLRVGGKGIAFGQIATEDGFHDYMGATFHNGLEVVGNLKAGGAFSTDPTDSFQTTLFGSNKKGYRLQTIRSEMDGVTYFPNDSCGIAFTGGDTHGFLFPKYRDGKAWIGAGSSDKINWAKEIAFKDDQSQLMGVFDGSTTISSTDHVKLTLTEKVKNGSLLSISDGGIKIGTGVTKVEVSGNVYFSTGMNEGDSIRSFIYKNDEVVAHNYNRASGTYEDRPISPILLSVNEGDIIYLYASNASAGRGVITENNYLVVKVIG